MTVPKNLTDDRIEAVIKGRKLWIQDKLRLQASAVVHKPKEYVSGEAFAYLGRNYRLKCVQGAYDSVKLKKGYLEVCTKERPLEGPLQASVRDWYQTKALLKLTEKTKRYASILKVEPTSINLKAYKARWGSCSPKGNLSYNWRIILAPHHIVDYVVVHELCHLIEHNHSPGFWSQVRSVIPDYDTIREWLKTNGSSLLI